MGERLSREQVVVYTRCGDERLAELAWEACRQWDRADAAEAKVTKLSTALSHFEKGHTGLYGCCSRAQCVAARAALADTDEDGEL